LFLSLTHSPTTLDREEALKDDFQLEAGYGYDEDEEWNEDESAWTGEEENEDDGGQDVKDESTAYLEFLNEEVSRPAIDFQWSRFSPRPAELTHVRLRSAGSLTRTLSRHKSLALLGPTQTMSSAKIAFCSSRPSTRLSRTVSSVELC
jgi:hypothetical protein